MKVSAVILLILTLSVAGCKTTTVAPITADPGKKISQNESVYIVSPRDGAYGAIQYQGSGASVATALEAAFLRFAHSVSIGPHLDSISDAIEVARQKKCEYVVFPKITHWEDRATEWSGRRDKIGLFVKVICVEDGSEAASAEITGKSAWFTFGGDHPQDLLRGPIQEFVSTLF